MTDKKPFIERPDEHAVQADELICWMSTERICGGDCVAYEERFEGDPRISPCMLLNVAKSGAHALNLIGIAAKQKNRTTERESQKQQLKDLSPEPPEVR